MKAAYSQVSRISKERIETEVICHKNNVLISVLNALTLDFSDNSDVIE
jgi:hypothetical protein